MTRLHGVNHVRKVRRLNAVLTNEPVASATFYLRRDFWMGSLSPVPNPYLGTVEVPTMSLDRLLRDEAINLIVCDVEGAEDGLFEGADLSGVDRIYLETHDHVTGLSGHPPPVRDDGRAGLRLRPPPLPLGSVVFSSASATRTSSALRGLTGHRR